MKTRPITIPRILILLMLITALCGLGLSLVSSESNAVSNHFFANKTGAAHLERGTSTAAPLATPTPFSHPLLFPPVATETNVSIGIDEACVQILDGPCTS